MNQRYPQSRHTPHGGSEKTDTERKVPLCKLERRGARYRAPVRGRAVYFSRDYMYYRLHNVPRGTQSSEVEGPHQGP